MKRLRVATLQYLIRPIRHIDEFREQVTSLVHTAADYDCQLVVFPEYFSIQLLTLGDVHSPLHAQVRDLADRAPEIHALLRELAIERQIHIVGGTTPVRATDGSDRVFNECPFVDPAGEILTQAKLHMTRFEREVWDIASGDTLRIFETPFGKVAVCICYDVEFPELARAAAHKGCQILVVPSYTDDRQGFLRVRTCAAARAIENTMYVIHSGTVGSLPAVPAISLNYGQASILTPSDFPFARDGVLAEGIPNQETMVIGELNLDTLRSARSHGTVIPLRDSKQSKRFAAKPERVRFQRTETLLELRSQARTGIEIRTLTREDFPAVQELARLIYPDVTPWNDEQLANHLEVFPQGQLVAVDRASGQLVGSCSSLILDWDRYDPEQDWSEFTDGGMYTNHDPVHGRTLFGADVMVRPGMQGKGIGKRLYARGRFGLARQLGLKRVLAGSRLRGYHRYADSMTPEEYVIEVVQGRLNDPTLSFQLKQGFRVLTLVSGYFLGDPESLGHAAVIEWLNPEVATEADYEQGDPRFRPDAE